MQKRESCRTNRLALTLANLDRLKGSQRSVDRKKPHVSTTRGFLLLALITCVILLAGCTDHLDITGLPTSCKGVGVEMKITQAGDLKAVDTIGVSPGGVAHLMLGAVTQSKTILKPGHSPSNPEPNVIYTADPVLIELRFKDPCGAGTRQTALVLDDVPHHKTNGKVTYVVKYEQFKSP